MLPMLAQIFMGWPAILGSLGLSLIGVARKSPPWLLGGALLSVGFAWYLTGWLNLLISSLGYALPFLHIGGALAVQRRKQWLAWVLLIPHALIVTFLATVVLSQ
jgi:hypothetical protein